MIFSRQNPLNEDSPDAIGGFSENISRAEVTEVPAIKDKAMTAVGQLRKLQKSRGPTEVLLWYIILDAML